MNKNLMTLSCLALSCLVMSTQQSLSKPTIINCGTDHDIYLACNGTASDDTITVKGSVTYNVYAGAGDDTINAEENTLVLTRAGFSGENGRDSITGGDVSERFYGGDGNDTLYGKKGDDKLSGGNGNDTLYGGNGNDYLNGGPGKDTLKGEGGADEYYFAHDDSPKDGNNQDTVYYGPGDYIYLSDGSGHTMITLIKKPNTNQFYFTSNANKIIINRNDPTMKKLTFYRNTWNSNTIVFPK